MIILNEESVAKERLETPSLDNSPLDILTLIARYYIKEGYKPKVIQRLLETYILRCDSMASLPKWGNVIDIALKNAARRPLVKIRCISVSKTEIETIQTLQGRQAQRLAFTLLCLSKYWNAVNRVHTYWVNTPDNQIMKLANIKASIKQQSAIYRRLRDAGLIEFSRKIDNTNVRVLFADQGTPVLQVEDFRNLGFQYQQFLGEPYKECALCGEIFPTPKRQKGMPRKYCKSCATISTHIKSKLMKS